MLQVGSSGRVLLQSADANKLPRPAALPQVPANGGDLLGDQPAEFADARAQPCCGQIATGFPLSEIPAQIFALADVTRHELAHLDRAHPMAARNAARRRALP